MGIDMNILFLAILISILVVGSVLAEQLTVTAYCMNKQKTASGKTVKPGYIAVSRDVEREMKLRFGDLIVVQGLGVFSFQDRMHKKKKKSADIFMYCKNKAKRFGKKRLYLNKEK
jgi:3D (Asp-Asp-Asp) domain-containing protein